MWSHKRGHVRGSRKTVAISAIVTLSLIPAIAATVSEYPGKRLRGTWPSKLLGARDAGVISRTVRLTNTLRVSDQAVIRPESLHLDAGAKGEAATYMLPLQTFGIWSIRTEMPSVAGDRSRFMMSHAPTVPVRQQWTERFFFKPQAMKEVQFAYAVASQHFGRLSLLSDGHGDLEFTNPLVAWNPNSILVEEDEIEFFDTSTYESDLIVIRRVTQPGRYRVVFDVGGTDMRSLFRRKPDPVHFSAFLSPYTAPKSLDQGIALWMLSQQIPEERVEDERLAIPVAEGVEAPWWS